MRFTKSTLVLGALLALGACASSGPRPLPTYATGETAATTLDGLVQLDNTVFALGFAKPDLDLSPYTKFMLGDIVVAYERDPQGARTPGTAQGNFEMSQRQIENFKELFREAIIEALTEDDGYPLVDEPGPDVLLITPSLVDLVVNVPVEMSGRNTVLTASYGEVTMIVDARDSETMEALARVADREDPTRQGTFLVEVTPGFVRSDVQRMLRGWADIMRERLDQLREVGRLGGD